jgi:glycosyltransferase involved in cell wall biosynthesis
VVRILEDHPEVELVMMGYDGGWKQRLAGSSSASDHALASRIDYYPWHADLASYPRAVASLRIDVAIAPLADVPFNRHRSNLKFLEFGALGIPIVASKVEPYAEIEDGVTGFLAKDATDLHRKLDLLVVDEALRAEVGRRAQAWVRERYDIHETATRLFDLFREQVRAKRVPAPAAK